jgi:hypothetical protein
MRRASMMSVSAPAGRVRRNIGRVVATCTADTIIGSGLRLVMSQFDEVSNMANPTFDAELAMSMTVNAKLPKTPQRQSLAAGASDLAVNSLDKRSPSEEREIGRPISTELLDQMANSAQSFKAPQCEKRPQQTSTAAQKVRSLFTQIQSVPAATSIEVRAKQFSALFCGGYWSRRSAPPRTRQISRACGGSRTRIPLDVVERRKAFLTCLRWRWQMAHSAPAIMCAVRRRDPGDSPEGRELHARLKLGPRVRRGAN